MKHATTLLTLLVATTAVQAQPAASPSAQPLQMAQPTASADRRGGGLVVPANPRQAAEDDAGKRLRTHVEGPLAHGDTRTWVGPPVPAHVELMPDEYQELFLLDPVAPADGGGHFAFYREPYGPPEAADRCGAKDAKLNCEYTIRHYTPDGKVRFSLPLAGALSKTHHLEVQDIRYDGGVVYFNEACQSYAKEAKNKCSSLVALDPVANKVLWRTKPLVSNSRMAVLPNEILTGYGFTNEPDFLHLVDRKTGQVLAKAKVSTAAQTYQPTEADTFAVTLHDAKRVIVYIDRKGKKPKLMIDEEK